MTLDMRSILFVHSIINIVILFLSIVIWIGHRKHYPGTLGWMTGLFAAACGEVLIMFRNLIPVFFSIVIGNTLLFSGFVLFYFGLRHFIENKVKGYFNLVLIFIFLVLYVLFGIVWPSLYLRFLIYSVFAVIISSQCVWFLIKSAKGKLKLPFTGLAFFFLCYGIVYSVRFFTTIIWHPENSFLESGILENIYLIISQVIFLIIGIFLVVIINKQLQSELQIYADENKLLVQEIHHRVKNNLQMILSLLRLQSSRTDETYIKECFNTIQNRILSISIVHEKLYRQKDLKNIELSSYLKGISEGLINSYALNPESVRFTTNDPECMLDIAKAVPLGLILNELVTNSIKHAFPRDHFGTIQIGLFRSPRLYSLSVRDDGIGLPDDFILENHSTLGSRMLITLVRQLDGIMEYKGDNGTFFKIDFTD